MSEGSGMDEVKLVKAEMWDYLSGFDKYNKEIPFYVKNPFTNKQKQELRNIINDAKNNRDLATLMRKDLGGQEEAYSYDRFDPRIITHMSRMIVEFKCPEDSEEIMNSHILPIYKEPLKLAHYSYLDYNPKYGNGKYLPSLPPHIDGANTILTFNYCLDTNIDWDIYVDNKRYELKKDEALVFSAINQVHWRPKREWKDGDFCEILTFDYSPLDDWRFTGLQDPMDYRFYPDFVEKYQEDLATKKEYVEAWNLYNELGLELGMDMYTHGKWYDGTATDNN